MHAAPAPTPFLIHAGSVLGPEKKPFTPRTKEKEPGTLGPLPLAVGWGRANRGAADLKTKTPIHRRETCDRGFLFLFSLSKDFVNAQF